MADLGHVKISRRMFAEDPLWTEPRTFSRAEAWIDLVQRAAWRPYRQVAKGVVVELDRGEVLASLRFLASAWGWGIKKVRVFLSLLVEMDRIRAQQETHPGTVYLIVNYEHYQGGGQREDTADGTVGAQSGHSRGTVGAQRESSKAGKAGKEHSTPHAADAADADSEAFNEAWDLYPKRAGGNPKGTARKAWSARMRERVDPAEITAGVRRYAAFIRATGKEGTEYVMQAATMFGPGERWREEYQPPTGNTRPGPHMSGNYGLPPLIVDD